MAEEISLLQQAFAETGVQLDRIINAYEREKKPFVPIGFPAYCKVSNLSIPVDSYIIIKLESYTNGTIYRQNNWDEYTQPVYYGPDSYAPYVIGFSDGGSGFTVGYDANFTNLKCNNNGYSVEWVDPSTLPQS